MILLGHESSLISSALKFYAEFESEKLSNWEGGNYHRFVYYQVKMIYNN
jgi:hypothetical protein